MSQPSPAVTETTALPQSTVSTVPVVRSEREQLKQYLLQYGLVLPGPKLEGEVLQLIGTQAPSVWRNVLELTLAEVLGDETAADIEVRKFTSDELLWSLGAVFKKIAVSERTDVFKKALEIAVGNSRIRNSIERAESPPARVPELPPPRVPVQAHVKDDNGQPSGRPARAAKIEANQRLTEINQENVEDGPLHQHGLRLHKVRRKDDPSSSSSSSTKSKEDDDEESSTTYRSTTRSLSQSRTSFKDPKILYIPENWERAFGSGETSAHLEVEIRKQLGVNLLHSKFPGEWTTTLADRMVELAVQWAENPADVAVPEGIIEVLYRCKLFSEGKTKEQIEEAAAVLRGEKLPKKFREANKKANKKQHSMQRRLRNTTRDNSGSTTRLSKEEWQKLSPEEQEKIKKQRKTRR